ncbi:MAG: Na/Pi cotransporter family protein, partial [Synergistaceae bacterium]|nr:Na/Pi cotransporter family protein [Synergistaceae bacterium]
MSTGLLFNLLGGVGLFLYGIKLMGESLQDLAGDRMRRLISALTSSPLKGVAVGALITAVIQASGATTVMTASFVHAGLMTLKQSVGVMMGAAIGTTVTAQLVAFKIGDFALPLIGFGMLFAVFGRSKKQKFIGNGIVGFGLLFLGMLTMGNAMNFLRERQDIYLAFQHHPILGVMAGTALTMLVQSSSATVGLTIVMGSQGLLTLDSAIPILFGDNIGTTITAVLASLGMNRSARQSALAHVLFKVIGVAIFLAFVGPFKDLVLLTSSDIARQLANAHTLFNV